jgi:hypothetical protein
MDHIEDYLGDGVYVRFDGFGLELRANDNIHPTDIIYLEPEVLKNLNTFYLRITDTTNMRST